MVVGVLPTDVVLRKSGVVSLQFRSFHPLNRAPMSTCSGRLSFVLMKLQIHCTCTTHNYNDVACRVYIHVCTTNSIVHVFSSN